MPWSSANNSPAWRAAGRLCSAASTTTGNSRPLAACMVSTWTDAPLSAPSGAASSGRCASSARSRAAEIASSETRPCRSFLEIHSSSWSTRPSARSLSSCRARNERYPHSETERASRKRGGTAARSARQRARSWRKRSNRLAPSGSRPAAFGESAARASERFSKGSLIRSRAASVMPQNGDFSTAARLISSLGLRTTRRKAASSAVSGAWNNPRSLLVRQGMPCRRSAPAMTAPPACVRTRMATSPHRRPRVPPPASRSTTRSSDFKARSRCASRSASCVRDSDPASHTSCTSRQADSFAGNWYAALRRWRSTPLESPPGSRRCTAASTSGRLRKLSSRRMTSPPRCSTRSRYRRNTF